MAAAIVDGIRATIAHLAIPISSVRPHPQNPNNGDIDAIAASLEAHGQYVPVVYNVRAGVASAGCLLKGNHTYHAMLQLDRKAIAAVPVDVDDEQALRILIADNRLSDLHRSDDGLLVELLQGLPDLDGTGYDERALDDLLASLGRDVAGSLGEILTPEGVADKSSETGRWLKFGEYSVPLTDAEYAALEASYKRHLEASGVAYGYVGSLLHV